MATKDGKVKKEVLGEVMPLEDEEALYAALGAEFVPPSQRTASGSLVPIGGAAAE